MIEESRWETQDECLEGGGKEGEDEGRGVMREKVGDGTARGV